MPEAVRVRWGVEHVPPGARRVAHERVLDRLPDEGALRTFAGMSSAPALDVAARRARIDEALRGADWKSIHQRVSAYAFARCRSRALAEDLSQEAIRCVLDPVYAEWDPQKQPSLVRLLGSIVNRNLWNERQRARSQREVTLDDESRPDVPDAHGFSERVAIDRDRFHRAVDLLRARFESKRDALALAVLDAVIDGADTPAALASELGRPIDEIVFARRRLHRAAAEVARTTFEAEKELAS